MSKIIQEVKINEEEKLFIIGFDEESNILTFRTSFEPNYKQEEKVSILKDVVRTSLYFFHISYLIKFIKENSHE